MTEEKERAEAGLTAVGPEAYAVIEVFAEGGIGRILRAHDRRLDRPVALKELLTASRSLEERFVREARLTARLQHPGVVPIYEVGRWPSGEPFYAMRLVAGGPLLDRIAAAPSLDQRLALLPHVITVAEAMAYAHSQRIIHRDLKPENVLVGEYGETVVIDWGLAKDLAEETAEAPVERAAGRAPSATSSSSSGRRRVGRESLTVMGAVMGTLAYMPPEQAYGDPVDERADVYAIGAILYHVIAGAPPYQAETAAALLAKVTTEEPAPIEALQPGTPRDLATILRKAMAERAADRYPTAKELADDLRRFQAGQLVAAHHYSRRERLRRALRRYRAPLAVGGVAAVLLALVGALSLARILAAHDAAEVARAEAELRADELALEHARSAAATQPSRALELLAQLHDQGDWRRLRTIAADAVSHGIGAALVGHEAAISRIEFSPDGRLVVTTSDDCTARIWAPEEQRSLTLVGHEDEVWRAAFSPDGRLLATSSRDATARVWDVATGAPLQVLRGHKGGTRALTFTSDGAAVIGGGDDDRLLRWDLASGAATELARCLAGSFISDGRRLACMDVDRFGLKLYDMSEGTSFHMTSAERLSPILALSPRDVLAVGSAGAVTLWSWRDDSRVTLAGPRQTPRALAFSADGVHLAAGTDTERIWRWREGERLPDLELRGGAPRRLVFTRDGRHLLAAGGDRRVHVWRLEDGSRLVLAGFREVASSLALAPDGERFAAASTDGSARIWEFEALRDPRVDGAATASLIAAGGQLGYTARADGQISAWALDHLRGSVPLRVFTPRAQAPFELVELAGPPEAGRLAVGYPDGEIVIVDELGRRVGAHKVSADALGFRLLGSPDGRYLAVSVDAGPESEVFVLTLADGARRRLSGAPIRSWLWLDDGALAIASEKFEVEIFDVAAGTRQAPIVDRLGLRALALSADGAYLLSAGPSHTLHVFDRRAGAVTSIQLPNQSGVTSLAAIPGSTRALVATAGVTVEIWDYVRQARVGALNGSDVPIRTVEVSSDGRSAVTVAEDRSVRLWELGSGESREVGRIDGHVKTVEILPSGAVALNGGVGLYVWFDDLPDTEEGFRAWLRASGSARELRSPPPAARPRCPSLASTR